MQDDQDKQKPERITVAQDGYPQSWSFGAFGSEYRRTWITRAGTALPVLKKDNGK
jgi:hypothetical protein